MIAGTVCPVRVGDDTKIAELLPSADGADRDPLSPCVTLCRASRLIDVRHGTQSPIRSRR
ncbi:hypothetical protein [Streptomyces sp. NPDC050848]|uniref:hypothetical protein n=1 Tax=Streptomyces sp. NPDC050848 TaxID=3155791 RepID=UPI0033F2E1AD